MSTHNICFCGEIRKILCGYPLLSVAMVPLLIKRLHLLPCAPKRLNFLRCAFVLANNDSKLTFTQMSPVAFGPLV